MEELYEAHLEHVNARDEGIDSSCSDSRVPAPEENY